MISALPPFLNHVCTENMVLSQQYVCLMTDRSVRTMGDDFAVLEIA